MKLSCDLYLAWFDDRPERHWCELLCLWIEIAAFFIFCYPVSFDNLVNMSLGYQRYSWWLWVIMFSIVFRLLKLNNSKLRLLIFLIFLTINVLNRMGSSPQSFLVFQLARAEALGTRLRPWNTWYWYSWVIVDRCGPLRGRCGSFRVFRGFSNCGCQLRRLIMTKQPSLQVHWT